MQKVPVEKLNRITMKNHQGQSHSSSPVGYHRLDQLVPTLFEEGRMPLVMILDGLTDTRNFRGDSPHRRMRRIRHHSHSERGSVSVNGDAVKTSAGALLHLPVLPRAVCSRSRNIPDGVGVQNRGCFRKKAPYRILKPTTPALAAIVMGAEDTGISNEMLRRCDTLAAIPIKGNIGSLNVSVAAGIIMYEALRQRAVAGF